MHRDTLSEKSEFFGDLKPQNALLATTSSLFGPSDIQLLRIAYCSRDSSNCYSENSPVFVLKAKVRFRGVSKANFFCISSANQVDALQLFGVGAFLRKKALRISQFSVGAALMPPARKAHAMRHYANRSTHGVDPFMMLLTEGVFFSISSVEQGRGGE